MFRTVETVIVDEIHTLAGSKRGVHLALSLERLQQIAAQPVQRIGLSATIRPLDEVARYLGGAAWQGEGEDRRLTARPVTIVDAGYRKPLDLRVESVVDDFRDLAGDSAGSGGERDIIEDTPVLEASRDLRDRDRCSRIRCEGRV